MDHSSQCQSLQAPCQRDSKPSSTHHKRHLQWPDWESTVYNSYQRSLPLISSPDQRNLPSYFDTNHASILAFDPVVNYDFSGQDWQNVVFDEDFGMGDNSFDTSPDGEAPLCDPVNDLDISITFPEGFFINPFAVSFPGDLPCPNPISMERDTTATFFSPTQTVSHSHPVQGGRVEKIRPRSDTSSASTKVSSPLHVLEHKVSPPRRMQRNHRVPTQAPDTDLEFILST